MQEIFGHNTDDPKSVEDAGPYLDRGGFLKVARADRDLFDLKMLHVKLDDDLSVKNKTIRIFLKMNLIERACAVSAKSGMVLTEISTQYDIFKSGEQDIGIVFPQRHTTF